jgi:carboxymethylenebutenolidase
MTLRMTTAMISRSIEIATPRGVLDAYMAHPEGAKAAPLVVLLMDIWGLREELFAICRRIAANGYSCILPNLYYRDGRISYPTRDADGNPRVFEALSEAERAEMRARVARIDRAMIGDDMATLFEFCRGEPAGGGAAGVIGFCMGGRFAFFAAQTFPDRFRATASLHGTHLVTAAADSVHRTCRNLKGEVYCGFGETDALSPPEVVAALDTALAEVDGLRHEIRVHAAGHGYAVPGRDQYCEAAAERDWDAIFAMLRRQLAS